MGLKFSQIHEGMKVLVTNKNIVSWIGDRWVGTIMDSYINKIGVVLSIDELGRENIRVAFNDGRSYNFHCSHLDYIIKQGEQLLFDFMKD